MKRTVFSLLVCCLFLACLVGCGSSAAPQASGAKDASVQGPTAQDDAVQKAQASADQDLPAQKQAEAPTPTAPAVSRTVVIDPGHQARANTDQEPIGPGSAETKMKVTGGTAGVATGIPEYELTLTVSQLLRDELTARGYQVVMVRESHDVNLSNRERADIANRSGDIFLRIHANGSEDASATGAMTLSPTAQNPYPIGGLYAQCRLLSDLVLDGLVRAAGAKALPVWETDTMSGINWCQIPVTIVEMGFLSTPQEDVLLNSPDYQAKLVAGIANGVDAYFAQTAS